MSDRFTMQDTTASINPSVEGKKRWKAPAYRELDLSATDASNVMTFDSAPGFTVVES